MGDIVGYTRISTGDQDVAGQTLRLEKAGAIKVFTDVRSGWTMERPGLEALLAYSRKGGTLAVVRLDRLGRSRRLIAERTKDGIAAARARGKHPGRQPVDLEKVAAALKLVEAGLSPTVAARQLGLGRSTVYREVKLAGVRRPPL
jgi:DNA invertase Pin-like site-specific DNA recombinase